MAEQDIDVSVNHSKELAEKIVDRHAKPQKKAERKPMDPEVQAMSRIVGLLDGLDPDTAYRVACWAKEKATHRAAVSHASKRDSAIARINQDLAKPYRNFAEENLQ
jgi:hypothetical protein